MEETSCERPERGEAMGGLRRAVASTAGGCVAQVVECWVGGQCMIRWFAVTRETRPHHRRRPRVFAFIQPFARPGPRRGAARRWGEPAGAAKPLAGGGTVRTDAAHRGDLLGRRSPSGRRCNIAAWSAPPAM